MTRTTDWDRFRVDRISWPVFLKRNAIHVELLAAAAIRGRRGILEIGVGSGAQSAALSRLFDTVSVDNDHRILNAARPNLARFGPRTHLVAADAFALPFPTHRFGVGISQGLLEHFSDHAIRRLLTEQLRVCRSVVFSVPSDRYPRQDVGDERLMSTAQWRLLLELAVDHREYRVGVRGYRVDLEATKYSVLARRRLGSFSVLVTIDPRRP